MYSFSWIGRFNIIKMSIIAIAIYRISAIPIKIPMAFFTELEKNYPWARVLTQWIKSLFAMLESQMGAGSSPSYPSMLAFLLIHLEKQWKTSITLRPLNSLRRPRCNSRLLALVWPGPSHHGHLERESEDRRFLSVFMSPALCS